MKKKTKKPVKKMTSKITKKKVVTKKTVASMKPSKKLAPKFKSIKKAKPVAMIAKKAKPVAMIAKKAKPVAMIAKKAKPVAMIAKKAKPLATPSKKVTPAKKVTPEIAVIAKPSVPESRFSIIRDLKINKTELLKFKNVLEEQLKDLQHDFGKKYLNIKSTALPDVNDQASAESERNFEIRIKDRERKLIGKVQESLKKVAEGTYGICESCGDAIGSKRLMARPVTNLCINCKSQMEDNERREENMVHSLPDSKGSLV
ncbi:MAG: RNA polymerase-binding protein DksA [Proteobacteria bacterium]|nr:RNA polymerase-binding protein DksA [Pseudomonadota bacterium]